MPSRINGTASPVYFRFGGGGTTTPGTDSAEGGATGGGAETAVTGAETSVTSAEIVVTGAKAVAAARDGVEVGRWREAAAVFEGVVLIGTGFLGTGSLDRDDLIMDSCAAFFAESDVDDAATFSAFSWKSGKLSSSWQKGTQEER